MVRGDKVVIALILVVALSLFAFTKTLVPKETSRHRYLSVQVGGKELKRIPLLNVKGEKTYRVETKKGYNVIAYDKEGAWLKEADCPDQICVRMPKITKPGEMIICLPHELLVEIKTDQGDKNDLDIVLR